MKIQILGIFSEEDLGTENLQSHMAVAAGAEGWSPLPPLATVPTTHSQPAFPICYPCGPCRLLSLGFLPSLP